jgi:hypothetical protein
MRVRICNAIFLGGILFAGASSVVWAQQPTESDSKAQQSQSLNDHEAMMHRGEKGMGFSQTATTHHFLLKPNGGVISVSANDPKDAASRDQIRMHLRHIAHAFSAGDFNIPMFVHDQEPPGVPAMKRLAKAIEYQFRESDRGGEVVIASKSAEAVHAVHDFLIFQIREHKTGDPVSVP